MAKVALLSLLLLAGLVLSQLVPRAADPEGLAHGIELLTMTALAFIMIHVGEDFELDKRDLRPYAWDYLVAMSAAAFPWLLVSAYFLLFLLPPGSAGSLDAWREVLLAGRFAAPTSAGLLFTMLAAAGLGATWMFRKVRVLAIFDDLDTVLLMIPLKMLIVGLAWQMGVTLLIMVGQLWIAWRFLRRLALPRSWPWMLAYAASLVALCEFIYLFSTLIDDTVPVYIEVLLPAFVLGCVLRHDRAPVEPRGEKLARTVMSACFMILVGLHMPPLVVDAPAIGPPARLSAAREVPGWPALALHVVAVTALSNLGKLVPIACYRREASLRERLALAIAMFPRGEVGAGVLVVALGYGLGGAMMTVAALSLALNLLLTGPFIVIVRRLLARADAGAAAGREGRAPRAEPLPPYLAGRASGAG